MATCVKVGVWVPSNDETALEAVKYFDISPIPLSIADVRAGLQTGLIDTVATSPIAAIALQWHTQVNYLMDLPLFYICGVFAVDQKVFSKLSAGDQSIVRDIMGRMFRERLIVKFKRIMYKHWKPCEIRELSSSALLLKL